MRGRYLAVSSLTWSIAFTIGPCFAGLLLDSPQSETLWFVSGLVGILASFGFLALNKTRRLVLPAQKNEIPAGD